MSVNSSIFFQVDLYLLDRDKNVEVLEKYFAIWREGHNGWKNTAQWKIMSPITASGSLSLT